MCSTLQLIVFAQDSMQVPFGFLMQRHLSICLVNHKTIVSKQMKSQKTMTCQDQIDIPDVQNVNKHLHNEGKPQ